MQFGLIGKTLGHSYSKEIHEKIADYKYELLELSENQLSDFFKKRDFCGINVTIPYKQAVIPYLDEVSEIAQKIGAVNTIVNKDGRLIGDNTDFYGMLSLIKHSGITLKNTKVLILGTGGTSKTAFAVCEHLGAKETVFVSRTKKDGSVTFDEAKSKHLDAQIII
ncbi:MAG: shikimate dehydrogenase, partial [Clostridia bacterium]|nr:shikimate dehydrogenase [Clostridia bacterium]